MTRTIVGGCVALVLTAAVSAQGTKMAMEKMDHMAMEKTYTGCVESNQMGSYTLAHPAIADATKSAMKADSMKKDDAMARDTMAPESTALSAAAGVNLRRHVGHKVTVTGTDGDSMNGMAAFQVKSVKMIAGSCS